MEFNERKMNFYGVINPFESAPSFLVPIFINEGNLYIQSIGKDGRIEAFIAIDTQDRIVLQSSMNDTFMGGDMGLYAFIFPDGSYVVNYRYALKQELLSKLKDIEKYRYVYLDVLEFLEEYQAAVEYLNTHDKETWATNELPRFTQLLIIQREYKKIENEQRINKIRLTRENSHKAYVERAKLTKKNVTNMNNPLFRLGDTVRVQSTTLEGSHQCIQFFEGLVVRIKSEGSSPSFTVRRVVQGVGVERTFPLYSLRTHKIEVIRKGWRRRSKLMYLRNKSGNVIPNSEQLLKQEYE